MSGGVYTTDKSKSLGSLSDTNFDSLADGEVLKYNATEELWVNGTAGSPAGTEIVATDNLRSLTTGTGSNLTSGASNNVLLGVNAGEDLTDGDENVLIGFNTGKEITTGIKNVFIGNSAGANTSTSASSIIGIGNATASGGTSKAGNNSICIGSSAGNQNAGIHSINIGTEAGRFYNSNTDGFECINIGNTAGRNQAKRNCVNIGRHAGQNGNSDDAINIGNEAGKARSGLSSINLGKFANQTNGTTHNRAIVINASGVNVPSVADDTFVVKPIRNNTGVANALFYDATSGEITYDTAGGGGTEIVAIDNLRSLNAGTPGSGIENIVLGKDAGLNFSGNNNVILGKDAAKGNLGAINKTGMVLIGTGAGQNTPQSAMTSIGQYSGVSNGGLASVYLGFGAGYDGGGYASTIVINGAGGSGLNPTQANSCFIDPIRAVDLKIGTDLLYYDATNKELQRSSTDITKFHAEFNTNPTDITTSGATIVFDTTTYNINSGYNTSTGVFTAPINGFYRFECFYQLSTNDAITLNWEVNGIIDKIEEVYNAHGGSAYRTFTTAWTGIMGAGDTIELAIFSITGTIRFSKTAKNGLTGYYIGK